MMAYNNTEVPVSRSQEGIRKLILSRNGGRVAFVSDPPREGFQAIITFDGVPYQIRIFGDCNPAPESKPRYYKGKVIAEKDTTETSRRTFSEKEEKRIWRVLFYHMKSIFEAADSGVMEIRELLLPYIVTKSGKTISEHLLPNLAQSVNSNPARMLGSGE